MITITEQQLKKEAKSRGYRPEMLEKVYRLLDLLNIFMNTPFLKERLVLKGGTAINLFYTTQLPRLSVDLDFNYIGSTDREVMLKDKIEIERIILDLCYRERYELHRNPRAHAGGKMVLVYASLLGTKGRLEIDLNYLFRIPLWDTEWRYSPDWPKRTGVSVLNIHELAAGKLHALLGREASRDLFDSYQLLTQWPLDKKKLRLAFTVYAGMERDNWRRIGVNNIQFTVKDIRDKLVPVLQQNQLVETNHHAIQAWAEKLAKGCKTALGAILPFNENEIAFLECLEKHGEIKPELISGEESFCFAVKKHPSLLWRSKQVLK